MGVEKNVLIHSGIEARSATDLWRTGYIDLFPPA